MIKRPLLVVAFSDTHDNSIVGLCNPEGVELDGGGLYIPPEEQRFIWTESWLYMIERAKQLKKKLGAWLYVFEVGDGSDDNSHSKHGLISVNKAVIIKQAVNNRQLWKEIADEYFLFRGTEAHDGRQGEIAETIARELKTTKDKYTYSWYHGKFTEYGVNIDVMHHPRRRAYLPHTKANAVNGEAVFLMMKYYAHNWRPHVAFRGHVHYYGTSENNYPVHVYFLPPNQLCTSYVKGKGEFDMEPIGGLFYLVEPNGQHRLLELVRRKPDVVEAVWSRGLKGA